MKITLIYKHLKPVKWYNELYDQIVKDGGERWESRVQDLASNPTEKQLDEMKSLMENKGKNELTRQEVWECNHGLMTLMSFAVSQGYKDMREKDRKKTIREWRAKDRKKDERVLNTKPFDNIKCPICESLMEYQWSELYDKGTLKEPDEQVMFFYECPQKCKRKLIFEDGTPWISKDKNLCPICHFERTTTVTRDNQNKMYFIHECKKCSSRQVTTEND